VTLDRLPIVLGAMLCAALALLWWLAPALPAHGAGALAAADFAASLKRQRSIVWPLGVATSIVTLIVLMRHGSLRSRRGALQVGAAAVLLASGVLSSLATEPAAARIVEILRSGAGGAAEPLHRQLGLAYSLHLALSLAALVCLVVADREPPPLETPGSAGGLSPHHRTLLFLLGTATLFQGYDTFIVSMALPYIGRDLGASESALGLALSAIRIGALSSIVLGRAADRLGRRGLLLGTVLAYTGATVATGLSRDLVEFVACQLVAEVFLVTELSLAQVVIAEEFPASARSLGQGLLGTFGALGAGMAAVLFPVFQDTALGWRGLYFVGVAPLLLVAYLRRSLPETRRWQDARERGDTLQGRLAELVAAAHRRDFLVLIGLSFALGASAAPAFGFASYRATNAFGWSPSDVSAMVLVGGGLGMAGWFVAGWLGESLGRRHVGMLSFGAIGVAVWAYYDTRWLAPWFAILVFAEAGATVALNALGTELFPTHLRSTAKSWITNAAVVGAIAGMGAVGALGDALGGADAVIRLLALAPIASAMSLAALPETSGLELEEIRPASA
jgi:MFS transporter, putative metabolite:H+ symporter